MVTAARRRLEQQAAAAEEFIARKEAEKLSNSFEAFVRAAWDQVEPGRELKWNWHTTYMCLELEALAHRQELPLLDREGVPRILNRLIMNVPVRTMKSLLVSVFYLPWVWTWAPGHQFMTLSHSDKLAHRDAVKSRVIVQSEWYQRRWGKTVAIRDDQNEKSYYENTANGHRISMGMKSAATGHNADTILIDDPHDAKKAESDADRTTVLDNYDAKFSSRLNDPTTGAICLVMQRLNALDLTGHLLREQSEYRADEDPDGRLDRLEQLEEYWEHLCLEMEFGGTPRYKSSLGLDDPRKDKGELLWPDRFPKPVVARMVKRLGTYGASGQLQQRPSPEAGGILKKYWWRKWPQAKPFPACVHVLQSYDTAYTEKEHNDNAASASASVSYSARTTWGVFYSEERGRYCILLIEAWRDMVDYPVLRREAQKAYGDQEPDAVLIEKKASGQSLIQDLRRGNIPVVTTTPTTDKTARAYSVQPVLESGLVYYPDRRWAEDVVEDISMFPNGASADWTDTATQAWERIRRLFLVQHPDDVPEEDEYEEPKLRKQVAAYG